MSGLKARKKIPIPKKNKFNARKAQYNGDIYDSEKERNYARTLDIKRKAKGNDKVLEVSRQVPFDIRVNDIHIAKYILDFKVTYPNRVEHIDVKGYKKGAAYQNFRLKKKLVEAIYGIVVIEV